MKPSQYRQFRKKLVEFFEANNIEYDKSRNTRLLYDWAKLNYGYEDKEFENFLQILNEKDINNTFENENFEKNENNFQINSNTSIETDRVDNKDNRTHNFDNEKEKTKRLENEFLKKVEKIENLSFLDILLIFAFSILILIFLKKLNYGNE